MGTPRQMSPADGAWENVQHSNRVQIQDPNAARAEFRSQRGE